MIGWLLPGPPFATKPGGSVRGAALRQRRLDKGLSLREAANGLGMPAADLCAVELGRLGFADDGDWERAIRKLASVSAHAEGLKRASGRRGRWKNRGEAAAKGWE